MSRRHTPRAVRTHSPTATIERPTESYFAGYIMGCGCWSEQPAHTCRRMTGTPLTVGCTCNLPPGHTECEEPRGVAS